MTTVLSSISSRFANAVPSTAASLGVTSQPARTGATTVASPNAQVATGFSSTPAATTSNAGVAAGSATVAAAASQLGTTTNAVQAAQNVVSSQFGANTAAKFTNAAAGGGIADAFMNGVARIASFAQNGMKSIEQAIQADMSANNGQIDPAKMQQYSMQMSTFEMIMQMAAKIQEKQERSTQVWLQI